MKATQDQKVFRTRFAKDIVAEVALPVRQTGKIAIICLGAPSVPSKRETLQFLAEQGYVVIFPRYRGTWESDGWFLEKSPAEDIKDIITELSRTRSVIDIATEQKQSVRISAIHLFSASFGGPAVLLNSHLPLVKKIIAFCPVLDWRAEGEDEPFDFWIRFMTQAFGGAFRTRHKGDWQKFIKTDFYNPIAHTSRIDGKKILIIHSKDDTVVPCDPVIPFAEKTGASYYLKPHGGHAAFAVLHHRFYWKKIEAFLKKK